MKIAGRMVGSHVSMARPVIQRASEWHDTALAWREFLSAERRVEYQKVVQIWANVWIVDES